MKAGTFFSGIDAPEVSAPHFDWRWRAEIDPFANAVSEHHRPSVPNLGDMEKADFDHAEPVELVVFGSPCQSFSIAGKRLGLDDPRGNLALVALAAIGRIQPRWFVFENVPGLLSSDGGRDFGAFLGAVGQLRYGWAYRTLDAQYFGVPQRRRRVFVVGCLGDWRGAAAVLFERESLHWNPTPCREAWEGVAGGAAPGAPSCIDGQNATDVGALCGTLQGEGMRRQNRGFMVAHALRAEGFDASEDGTGRGTPLVPVAFDMRGREGGAMPEGPHDTANIRAADGGSSRSYIAFSAKDYGADAGETAPTLRAGGHVNSHANAGVMPAVAIAENQRAELRTMDTVSSLSVGGGKPGRGYPATMQGMTVRRLTPPECERLQGFPDDFTRVPYRSKPASQCPDGPRYKALGNSMAVPCIGWILKRLAALPYIHERDDRTTGGRERRDGRDRT